MSAQEQQPTLREQASWWLVELEEACAGQRQACLAWLKQSPDHVREFLLVLALWKGLDGADAQHRTDVEKLLEEASATVVPLKEQNAYPPASGGKQLSWTKRRMGLAAGIAVIAAAAAWMGLSADTGRTYSTAVGEQRSVKLTDGSVVQLNTHSRMRVRFDSQTREIDLLDGEALFAVARDKVRPFTVRTQDASVQVLGTQFNIYRTANGTVVSVVEGKVKVLDDGARISGNGSILTAGEQARVSASGGVMKQAAADVDKAVAWRQRQLIFRGDSLAAVAAELNRYNDEIKIRVEDDTAGRRKMIGVFAADDPESLLQFLAKDEALVIDRRDGVISIRSR